jgi:hypothetical protein
MKVDLTRYTVNRSIAQRFYRTKKSVYDLGTIISLCATTTGCPCVVIAFYLGEGIGFTPEVIDEINRFIKFYGYSGFIGAPESYYEAIRD